MPQVGHGIQVKIYYDNFSIYVVLEKCQEKIKLRCLWNSVYILAHGIDFGTNFLNFIKETIFMLSIEVIKLKEFAFVIFVIFSFPSWFQELSLIHNALLGQEW